MHVLASRSIWVHATYATICLRGLHERELFEFSGIFWVVLILFSSPIQPMRILVNTTLAICLPQHVPLWKVISACHPYNLIRLYYLCAYGPFWQFAQIRQRMLILVTFLLHTFKISISGEAQKEGVHESSLISGLISRCVSPKFIAWTFLLYYELRPYSVVTTHLCTINSLLLNSRALRPHTSPIIDVP